MLYLVLLCRDSNHMLGQSYRSWPVLMKWQIKLAVCNRMNAVHDAQGCGQGQKHCLFEHHAQHSSGCKQQS